MPSHEKSSCQPLRFTRKNIADPKVIKPLEMRFHSVHGTGYLCPISSFCLPQKTVWLRGMQVFDVQRKQEEGEIVNVQIMDFQEDTE